MVTIPLKGVYAIRVSRTITRSLDFAPYLQGFTVKGHQKSNRELYNRRLLVCDMVRILWRAEGVAPYMLNVNDRSIRSSSLVYRCE